MPRIIDGKNGGKLHPRVKGDPPLNKFGRPKKTIAKLKNFGYNTTEIQITTRNLFAMTVEELKWIAGSKTSTVLEKMIAFAIRKSLMNSDLNALLMLLGKNCVVVQQPLALPNGISQDVVETVKSAAPQDAMRIYQDVMK